MNIMNYLASLRTVAGGIKRLATRTLFASAACLMVAQAHAQFADPALSTAAFYPIRTPIGTTAELRFTFANSGSTPIPANSIELAVCPAFNYYTSAGAPFGALASSFTWTPPGPGDDDCWRGVNNVAIAAFGGGQIRITYNANAITSGPELTNINVQLIANFTAFENASGNDNLQPELEIGPLPNLVVAKTATVATAPAGGSYTYTLNVSNSGPGASAANTVITDNVPAGVNITGLTNGTGWICTPTSATGPATITCTRAAGVLAGVSNQLVATLNATKTVGGSVTNVATVTSGDPGCTVATPPARCVGTAIVDDALPNLSVTKTASVASAAQGSSFTYTINVSNSGPVASAANTVVTDNVPAGVSITGLTNGAGWTCTPSTLTGPGNIVCTNATGVAAGASNQPVVTLNATKTSTSSVANTASVTSGDPACVAPLPARCTSTVTVTDDSTPDMTSTVACTPSPANVGATVSCAVTCTNIGPVAALGATCQVSNAASLPAGATVVCPNAANPVDVAPGATLGCSVLFSSPTAGTVTVNSTTAASNEPAAATGNNNGTTNVQIVAAPSTADMVSTVSCTPSPGTVGSPVTCTAICTNAGAVTATAATCSINTSGLPGAPTASCSPSGSVVPGGTLGCTVTFTPTVATPVTVPATTSATNDGNPSNNDSSTTVPINSTPSGSTADMTSTVACTPNPANAGATVTCTVTCTNVGTATANNAFCSVPNATSLPGSPTPSCSANGSVAAGASLSCTVSFVATGTLIPVEGGTGADNDSNGGSDPRAGNNASVTPVVVNNVADMTASFSNMPSVVAPGQTYTGLTLVCRNIGQATATAATCAPSADVGTVSNISCTPTPPASVNANANITCTFDYTAPPNPASSDVTPTAVNFSGSTGAVNDGNASNNTATANADIIDAVNDTGSVGSTTGGTIAILTNDQLGATVNPSVGVGGITAPTIVAGPGTTLPGASINASNQVVVPPGTTPGTYTVEYRICAQAAPTVCDTALVTITVTDSSADMVSAITLPAVGAPGSTVTGTIVCTNNGPAAATNATCSASGAGVMTGSCTASSGTAASLPVGATLTCPVVVSMPGTPGGSNTPETAVTVSGTTSATNEIVTGNNGSSATVAIIDALDDNLGTIGGGVGGTTAVSVLGNDTVGAVGATLGGSPNVTLTPGTVATPPATGSIVMNANGTITVAPGTTPGVYTIGYTICSTLVPTACDSATATISVAAQTPRLVVRKSATVAGAAVSTTFDFIITVSNTGPVASASPTTIVDTLPVGVTVTAINAGAGFTCVPSSPLPLAGDGSASTVTCTSTAGVAAGTLDAMVVTLTVVKTGTNVLANTARATTGDGGCPIEDRCSDTVTISDTTAVAIPVAPWWMITLLLAALAAAALRRRDGATHG